MQGVCQTVWGCRKLKVAYRCRLMHQRKMTPRQAQQHLLDRRKVRSKLWRQRNVIQFYESLGGIAVSDEGDVELSEAHPTEYSARYEASDFSPHVLATL